jgi:hypothetical protein
MRGSENGAHQTGLSKWLTEFAAIPNRISKCDFIFAKETYARRSLVSILNPIGGAVHEY